MGPISDAHLVGLHEAHKHREEDRGRGCLGALPEVVDHVVEGLLRAEKRGRRSGEITCEETMPIFFFSLSRGHATVSRYLGRLGVLLQFVQLSVAGLDEALQHRVVVEAALPPDQVHAFAQLPHVQQHVFQGHWGQRKKHMQRLAAPNLISSFTIKYGSPLIAINFIENRRTRLKAFWLLGDSSIWSNCSNVISLCNSINALANQKEARHSTTSSC